jgi:hypothetical protein
MVMTMTASTLKPSDIWIQCPGSDSILPVQLPLTCSGITFWAGTTEGRFAPNAFISLITSQLKAAVTAFAQLNC